MDDKDLPLVSNVSDILVRHYLLDLQCNFSQKFFSGSVTLYLAPVAKISSCDMCQYHNKIVHTCEADNNLINDGSQKSDCKVDGNPATHNSAIVEDKLNDGNPIQISPFKCCLDCQDINVYKVEEISHLNKMVRPMFQKQENCKLIDHHKKNHKLTDYLNFSLDKWSLKIWKDGVYCAHYFPEVIKVHYCTNPTGLSLLWVNDQVGCNCVFTYGAWINNRSLFPCQEPPTAMATWEAFITVENDVVVLMSGDEEPTINCRPNGYKCYYYYTKMKLPMSTLALAVGYWKETEIPLIRSTERSNMMIKCRLFAPSSLFEKSKQEFLTYLPCCLEAAQYFLGTYPFPRIDILVVPRGFGSLGMASPNIIFLSQSILSNDEGMCVRLAHEVAHGWFGLLIGALDWTEEWLSEGFATFMEDIIHTRAMKMTLEEEHDYCELRYLLRLKTLQAEVAGTDEDLQVLRPAHGEVTVDNTNELPIVYVKNGQNPKKGFLQIHYLKGFFLLNYLCNLAGKNNFIHLLREYVEMYKGQLVQSQEIFNLYFKTFPSVRNDNITIEKIYADWLDTSILPKEVVDIKPSTDNRFYNDCIVEANKWKAVIRLFQKRSRLKTSNSKKYKLDYRQFNKLQSDQLVIVLESLLEEDRLPVQILKALEEVYSLKQRNADVRHRWCELIVKHHYRSSYLDVQKFLKDDLAMGVYLYGELLNSGNKLQQKMAKDCFYELFDEMEPNFKVTINEMIEQMFVK